MNSQSRNFAYGALTIAPIFWGGLFFAGKSALKELDPFWFTFIRYLFASLLLTLSLVFRGRTKWGILGAKYTSLMLFGLLGYGMFGIMVFLGLRMSFPSHEAVIMATMPITTLFIRAVFEKNPPPWWAWSVAVVALVGVGLVSGFSTDAEGISIWSILGDCTALIGTFGWIMYTRGQSKFLDLSVIEYTGFTALAALPGLAVIASLATVLGFARLPTLSGIIIASPAIGYIVIFGTVSAGLAYNYGVRTLGAPMGIVFINLVPISALVIGMAVGSAPSAGEILGTLVVMAALLIQARFIGDKVRKERATLLTRHQVE